jgi:hypothetical protein
MGHGFTSLLHPCRMYFFTRRQISAPGNTGASPTES